MTAPRRLLVVAGTGTEVGKTWFACRLSTALRDAGRNVAIRKPAQSYAAGDEATDADLLAAASGEEVDAVCPRHRWYEVAMAPFMAADVLGRPQFTLDDLVQETVASWTTGVDVGIVEAAGGVRSPITHDGGDTVDLARTLRPDLVVLVADAGLGTINAVRLCIDAFAGFPAVVFLNRFDDGDDLHRRNRDWLRVHLAVPVVTSVGDVAAIAGTTAPR